MGADFLVRSKWLPALRVFAGIARELIHHRHKAGGVSDPTGTHTFPETTTALESRLSAHG